jgi:hypothetical protein
MRSGTGADAARLLLHWQLFAGHPHFGQTRPFSLE